MLQITHKFALTFVLVCVCISVGCTHVNADSGDQWFGKDKLKHAGASAFYTIFSYKLLHHHFDMSKNDSGRLSVGFTLTLGLTKEYYDSKHPEETSSFKDIIADIAGIALGIYIATR
ncbi:MAG: hypothetical protein GF315_08640 [candidate division Zixibacteria bacterium]|nr:hypothetical protein [candidate division Zixibacteria bacterium]